MVAFFSFSSAVIDTWNANRFYKQSRQLGQLLRGDFSSIAAELARVFPHTTGLQERFVPLVSRYAHELSGLYTRPVVRRFNAPGEPSGLVKLQAVYAASQVDRVLHQAHRSLLVQNTVVLLVLPAGVGRVKLEVFEPWQVDWVVGDPLRADDVQAAQVVNLRVPIKIEGDAVIYGNLVVSQTEIYIDKGGAKVPVYGDSTRNPFGFLPLIVLRGEVPAPGRPFASVNEPLLNMNLALCVSESDTELLVHTQAWGQKVIENAQIAQQVEELQVGPDKVLALVSNDPQAQPPRLVVVQGQPPLAQITGWNESRLRLLCSMFDLSPDAFLKVNTAVTASARAYDARDRQEAKARYEPIFVQAEQELANVVGAVLNLSEPVKVPVPVSVQLDYPAWDPPVDPLHEAQALASNVALGVESAVAVVAARAGVSRAAARVMVENNLKERAELTALGMTMQPMAGAPAGGEAMP